MKIKNLRVENETREDLQGDSKLLCLKKNNNNQNSPSGTME